MKESTDMLQSCRNDAILNYAYHYGSKNGLDELEILKRTVLMLLNLKDECYQEKINKLMTSSRLFNSYK